MGSSLAAWLTAAGAEIVAVAGRPGGASADALARRLGGTAQSVGELATAGQGLLLLAVPDPALEAVAAELAARPQASVALHTSGSRDAELLAALRRRGSAVGSLHPLKAFPRALPAPAEGRGTVFGIDGDPEAVALAGRLADAVGGRAAEVPAAARQLYHLGASLAAGGVMTVLAAAEALASRAGVPRVVVEGYLRLAAGAVAQADPGRPLAEALTGPLARGDTATFEAQLTALEGAHPELAPLVRRLALETLARRAEIAPLTAEQQRLRRRLAAFPGAARSS